MEAAHKEALLECFLEDSVDAARAAYERNVGGTQRVAAAAVAASAPRGTLGGSAPRRSGAATASLASAASGVTARTAASSVWGVPGFAPRNADGRWDAPPASTVTSYPATAVTERAAARGGSSLGPAEAVARLAMLERSLADERRKRMETERKIRELKSAAAPKAGGT